MKIPKGFSTSKLGRENKTNLKEMKTYTILIIAAIAVLIAGGIALISNNREKSSVLAEEQVRIAESELSQVKQIVSSKGSEGIAVTGLEDKIKQIEILIERAKIKIREGNETEAEDIISKIRIFNREIIENQDMINSTFKIKAEIKSDISLPDSIKEQTEQLKNSLENSSGFIDLRIKIKKDNGRLRIDERAVGASQEQIALFNSIKEKVLDAAKTSSQEKFEIEVRIKRELEFENSMKNEIEIEFERELRNELEIEIENNVNITGAKLTREQAVQIAKSRVDGTIERVELEVEDGKLAWNVRIISNSIRNDIRIDDATGSIIRVRTEEDNSREDDNDNSGRDDED